VNIGTASTSNNADNTDFLDVKSVVTDISSPFRPLIIAFLITTVLALFIATRLGKQGQWLPPIPNEIASGAWTATDVPLDAKTMAELGTPNVYGRRYTNPFDEHIDAHVIAAASIESYHEPAFCMAGYGYTQTAQKILYPFGPGKKVRAIILRNNTTGQRVLLYFWVQDQKGETSTHGSFRAYQDYVPRMNLGLKVAVDGDQSCIIRAYTLIHPADPDGRQARRNLDSVAQALYSALKKGGNYKNIEAAS
jgi:hypothetical protein